MTAEAPDVLDYYRSCIWERTRDLATYCDIVMKLIEIGRDDRAKAMFDAVMDETNALKLHFADLGKGLLRRDQEHKAGLEERMQKAREIAERRANRRHEEADVAHS